MMRSICVSLLTCLVATCTIIAQEKLPDSKTTAADEKAIAVLIRQLGDESFEKREAATVRVDCTFYSVKEPRKHATRPLTAARAALDCFVEL